MPEYRFVFDETFLIESLRKNRKQQGFGYGYLALKSVAGLLLLVLAAAFTWVTMWWMVLLFVVLGLLIFSHDLLGDWGTKRRFRDSPYRNNRVVSTLTAEGLHAVGSQSDSKLAWSVFTKARSFRDGVLLFQGPQLFNWLPDDALSEGTRADVESLIRANVRDHRIVEQGA